MPTPLNPINLSAVIVGQTGTIDLTPTAPTSNPAWINKTATLLMYNESGVGLRISGVNSGVAFDLPAGGWLPLPIPLNETSLSYVVQYVLPNPPVSTLLATYYLPNEPVIAANLGNSPIGGNLSSASTLINIGAVSPTTIMQATPNASFGTALHLHEFIFNNDGSSVMGDAGTATPGAFFGTDANGNVTFATLAANTGIGAPGTASLKAPVILLTGHQESGRCGGNDVASAGAQAFGPTVNFKTQMTNVPSSITFSGLNTTNANAPSGNLIDVNGFNLFWTSVAGGATAQIGTYTTVGN